MIKTRDKIEEQYKWDLSKIYSNKKDIEKDIKELDKLTKKILSLKGKILDSATNLLNLLNTSYNLDRLFDKLYTYASLKNDEDLSNNKNSVLIEKLTNLSSKINANTSFIVPELLESDYKVVKEYIKEESALKVYQKNLKDIFRYKKHHLSKEEEKLLSFIMPNLYNTSTVYSIFTNSDMTFNKIHDEDNNLVDLNESNYSIYIRSKNKRVRKEAYESLFTGYKQFANSFTSTLTSFINSEVKLSKIYKYNSALESALFDDNVDPSIYQNLIDTINNNLEPIKEYLKLKKELLKTDKLHFYDISVSMIEDYDKKYSLEEAKEIVFNALEILGKDYIDILKSAFTNRWIDIYNNKGKRSGAYSGGSYDTYPYVLLNFEGTLNDVSTIAHELGHSMHSYYSHNKQPYNISQYKIFVAEVASTTNEILLNKYMIDHANSKEEKLALLNNLIELFRATFYRQTMFAEFELYLYENIEKDNVLTTEILVEEYEKLNKKYYVNEIDIDEFIGYEWCRVPHFYYNFYVYKYALGISAANYIANKIYNNDQEMIKKYKEFLSLGGSMDPIDELRTLGIDLNDPKIIEEATKEFKSLCTEFKNTYNETKKVK